MYPAEDLVSVIGFSHAREDGFGTEYSTSWFVKVSPTRARMVLTALEERIK